MKQIGGKMPGPFYIHVGRLEYPRLWRFLVPARVLMFGYFFSEAVPAREARRLGSALISHTCSHTRQLMLKSYDRLFPSQDTLPRGGFGNLIALPLQKKPRGLGRSVFVDEDWEPYPDQWAFLASIEPTEVSELEPAIQRAAGGGHPLDIAFVEEERMTRNHGNGEHPTPLK